MTMSRIRKSETLVGRPDKRLRRTLKVDSIEPRIDPEIPRFQRPDGPAYEYELLYENPDVDGIRRDLANIALPRTFRLLILAPGTENDVVECSLEQHDFDETGLRYEALSYAWESNKLEIPIICCGKALFITRSLYSALRHLRYPDKLRTLWTDAICINQNDVDERNHQVTLMTNVYSRATAVPVWLGESNERDCNAFDVIRRLASMIQPVNENGVFSYARSREAITEVFTSNLLSEKEWMQLFNLFQRAWFRRLWVVQEVALARGVFLLYGHERITLEAAETVVFSLGLNIDEFRVRLNLTGQGLTSKVRDFYNLLLLRRKYKGYSALDLLTNIKGRKCSDDRDQIYGMLGLAKTSGQQAMTPDYTADVLQVYRTFAVHNLVSEGSLDVLSCCLYWNKSELPSPWPSWVCDWRKPRLDPYFTWSFGLGFRAAGDKTPKLSIVEEGNVLSIRGRAVETVSAVSSALGEKLSHQAVRGLSSEEIRSIRRVWLYKCFKMAFGDSQPVNLDVLATPAAEPFLFSLRAGKPNSSGNWPSLDKAYLDYFGTLLQDYMLLKDSEGTAAEIAAAVDRNLSPLQLRVFCVMSSGRLGALPFHTRPGDIVCVLDGGIAPFVLRDDGDGYHRLIGEGYAHGIMHGEALDMEGVVVQEFKIR